MNILTTSLTAQNLIFIPRANVIKAFQDRVVLDKGTYTINSCYTPFILKVTSEDTNITLSYDVSATYVNEELTISQAFALKEGTYYNYEVLNGTILIYRGSIFCTDQTDFDKYVINNNDYVATAALDNEFVTI